jgi:hypothetical protein
VTRAREAAREERHVERLSGNTEFVTRDDDFVVNREPTAIGERRSRRDP